MNTTWTWILLTCMTMSIACQDTEQEQGRGQLNIPTTQSISLSDKSDKKTKPKVGSIIDRFNGVAIYYNGNLHHTDGRNVTSDGYNLGLKWQCVEFVKRYYYLRYGHRMPDPWGHAIDFFDPFLADGGYNRRRALYQYRNPSIERPQVEDIIVFKGEEGNRFGHVAIVSKVGPNYIEIVQQNVGKQTRYTLPLFDMVDSWRIANIDVLGWLRKKE